jgi:hypothetical protein
MGLALTVWQYVEEQHYRLFLKLLDVPDGEIPSVVYFSVESFESRRKMVSRMLHFFPMHPKGRVGWRGEWNLLEKQLKDYNEDRNKLAHYGLESNIDFKQPEAADGFVEIVIKPPTLQPSRSNRVSELLGRTADTPKHNLSATELDLYIRNFHRLATQMRDFTVRVSPRGASLSPYKWLHPPIPEVSPPPPLSKRPRDAEPSG